MTNDGSWPVRDLQQLECSILLRCDTAAFLWPLAADHECQLWGCEPRPGIRAVAAACGEASCSFGACTDSSLTDGMAVRWTICGQTRQRSMIIAKGVAVSHCSTTE